MSHSKRNRDDRDAQPEASNSSPPPPPDPTGEYLAWLDDACPVFSVTVLGKAIPKHVEVYPLTCKACDRQWEPELPLVGGDAFREAAPLREAYQRSQRCPKCDSRGVRRANARPRRVRQRLYLTADELREIRARLDASRPRINAADMRMRQWRDQIAMIRRENDALPAADPLRIPYPPPPADNPRDRARIVDGPEAVRVRNKQTGSEDDVLIAPFVHLVPVHRGDPNVGESPERATERHALTQQRKDIYLLLPDAESQADRQDLARQLETIDARLTELSRL